MRDATKGTYNGETTYCPVNAYGDCPYCDQCCVCHIEDPMEDCDDWGMFYSSWFEWVTLGDMAPSPDEPIEEEDLPF